jgi:fibroblast growth factor receptor 1
LQANEKPFLLAIGGDDGSFPVISQVLVRIIPINGSPTINNFVPRREDLPRLPNLTDLHIPPIPRPSYPSYPTTTVVTILEPKRTDESTVQNKTYIEYTTTESADVKNRDGITAIVPILVAIITIFLIAGLIAVIIFRKQLMRPFSRKFKKSKVDKAKKSTNQSIQIITLSDESSRNSMVMQHWQGPIAYNNRYTPWSHDEIHGQISNSSFCYDNKVPGYDRWEFPRHRLKVFNILGEGAFGQVWRCEANDIDGIEGVSTVAVKTLKENANESEKKDLMSELLVMKSLEAHVNVVRLLGCCTEKDPIFVIIEYVALGKLQTFLRNSRMEKNYHNNGGGVKSKTLTSRDLVSFMYQVARGMEFLSSRGVSVFIYMQSI